MKKKQAKQKARAQQRPIDVGGLVRAGREQHRISLRELGRRSGISAGQISRIEAGEVERPSVETLQAIAEALGRSAAPLLLAAGYIERAEFHRSVDPIIRA